ncbi:hypothetical protein LguiB_011358 [Lonicera macranthoides]
MAQVSNIIISKASILAFVVAIFSVATISAQETAPAPAPSPDAGTAFSLPSSGVVIGTFLAFSLLPFLRH